MYRLTHKTHEYLDLSSYRHVFVCGDIHGMYPLLEQTLHHLGFDTQQDALISVGDLTDRGTHNESFEQWIHQPWFFRTLGNHCVFPFLYSIGQISALQANVWGGDWYKKLSKKELNRVAMLLTHAPVSLTVKTPKGHTVGIAHADCARNWAVQIERLEANSVSTIDSTLESRETINSIRYADPSVKHLNEAASYVDNIDHVFHGHTILGAPFTVANRTWIDTGAYKSNILTILNIDDFLTG